MNCRVCGSPLPEGALFCGECGSAVNATPVTRAAAADPRASDTTIIERLPRPAVAGPAIVSREILFDMPGSSAADSADASGETGAAVARDATPDTVLRSGAQRDAAEGDRPVGRPGQEPPRQPNTVPAGATGDLRYALPVDAVGRHAQTFVPEAVERDTAAAAAATAPGATADPETLGDAAEPYVFVFSTGEEARITGGGLLGRRPIAQPGESVPQVVQISDPGRSVSKTHLEFGLEGGELWICDRYSGNGTIVYPPGARPRRCEPGRRYRVGRGSRVEIGDQYFDVS